MKSNIRDETHSLCGARYEEMREFQTQLQPIALKVSFLHSRISIDDLGFQVSLTTFRRKETKEIEIGDGD